ncbi:potassium transporter-domain-containing protein [Microdochium trichocladiopsis]|uniref:Potassium transporter-domain-containing protein n=1 Tax=Microdochium trichocladiopsis TaxID=1682393 RepID=A0A9P8YB90_9PEZI|nr:potassium transporter-domain-containing protein [Microdochium trichocladiopsis]KAH7034780.1 potassium transporter-domain-containing protein [Microdochium trichocladiopsis]
MAGPPRIKIDNAPIRPDRLRLQVLASLAAAGPASQTTTDTTVKTSTEKRPTVEVGYDDGDLGKQSVLSTTGLDRDVEAKAQQESPNGSLGFDIGGVYHTRSYAHATGGALPRTASPYPRNRKSRLRREEARIQDSDAAAAADPEDGEDWRRDDGKKKQVFRGRAVLWLAYQSIGVIYGDIGTSPLYVYSSTFTHEPANDELVQVLSVIIWTLTVMVTIKYVLIVLNADNEGEGGTFSCYSLLARYANIIERDPREQVIVKMERRDTHELSKSGEKLRMSLENSLFVRGLLKFIGVLAVSLVIADGVLTPAQSILGAVQGLAVVHPNITDPTIVGTTCGILIALFVIQPLGTTKLANTFAPIVILWLAFNAGFGVYNLIIHDHTVLRAFSPYFAMHFFMERKTDAWRMLGGVLLAFTGVEALFADLGAFSLRAIQISWLGWCYPCLLLAYTGQAAYISKFPSAYDNPFYESVPPGMIYPSLIVAILAAVIASQAMITAVSQLVTQLMKLSYCPQVNIVHTSKRFYGQIHVPFVNWILMLGCILVTAAYSNTTRLGNAYGVCVMLVTFFDTCMVTLVALIVWRLPLYLVFIPWLFYALLDGLFLSAALAKVPEGAWFTITLSGILSCLFLLWRFGKENQWRAEARDHLRPGEVIERDWDGKMLLSGRFGTSNSGPPEPLTKIRGFGIFFDKTGVMAPHIFSQFATKFGALPEILVFFHLHPLEIPTVSADERFAISKIGAIDSCYRLVIRHGFMDQVITPDLGRLIYEQLRKYLIRRAGGDIIASDHDSDVNLNARPRVSFEPMSRCRTAVSTAVQSVDGENRETNQSGHNMRARSRIRTLAANRGNGADSIYDRNDDHEENDNTQNDGDEEAQEEEDEDDDDDDEEEDDDDEEEEEEEKRETELEKLDRAYRSRVMYLIGKEQMKIAKGTSLIRKILLMSFLFIRDNTRAKIANLRLSMDRVVEVGFVKEV